MLERKNAILQKLKKWLLKNNLQLAETFEGRSRRNKSIRTLLHDQHIPNTPLIIIVTDRENRIMVQTWMLTHLVAHGLV